MNNSAHPYNDSIAQDFYPLEKNKALSLGALWEDSIEQEKIGEKYSIPDNIKDASDDIAKKVLQCEECSKPFRLILQEYTYYKQYNIPIPHYCFDCRYQQLMKKRLPRKMYTNTCAKTGKDILTSFAPDSGYIVYDKNEFDKEFA